MSSLGSLLLLLHETFVMLQESPLVINSIDFTRLKTMNVIRISSCTPSSSNLLLGSMLVASQTDHDEHLGSLPS